MRAFVSATLLFAALIHLLPLIGVLGAGRLESLYGITVSDPNVEILMRHRAVLFGLLGVLLAAAAFVPPLQPIALLGGLVSVVSFLVVAWWVGDYNERVARVVAVDLVALVLLAVGGTLRTYASMRA